MNVSNDSVLCINFLLLRLSFVKLFGVCVSLFQIGVEQGIKLTNGESSEHHSYLYEAIYYVSNNGNSLNMSVILYIASNRQLRQCNLPFGIKQGSFEMFRAYS